MTVGQPPQEAILAILEEEHRLYQRMLVAAEAKRDALLRADVNSLPPLLREMEGLTHTIDQLERDRVALGALLMGGGPGAVDESFPALEPHFTGNARLRLAHIRGLLREEVGRLRLVNQMNEAMVHQALAFTEHWMRVLRAAMPGTYNTAGTVVNPTATSHSWQA